MNARTTPTKGAKAKTEPVRAAPNDGRADHGHRGEPRRIAAPYTRFPLHRAALQRPDQCRTGVQQRRRGEAADTGAEALHERGADAEQHGRQQGDQTTLEGGQWGGSAHPGLRIQVRGPAAGRDGSHVILASTTRTRIGAGWAA
jgi:hypothetical protein